MKIGRSIEKLFFYHVSKFQLILTNPSRNNWGIGGLGRVRFLQSDKEKTRRTMEDEKFLVPRSTFTGKVAKGSQKGSKKVQKKVSGATESGGIQIYRSFYPSRSFSGRFLTIFRPLFGLFLPWPFSGPGPSGVFPTQVAAGAFEKT